MTDPRWYETFFDEDWLNFVALRGTEEVSRTQVDFVVERLGLPPGAKVLDMPCGHGRHALELARRGFAVTGVDLSEPSLEIARAQAGDSGLELELVHGDMREPRVGDGFDAGINLFSSLGYFATDEEHAAVINAFARAVRRGGRLLIEMVNSLWVFRHFEARGWTDYEDGSVLLEERAYDPRSGRNTVTWRYVRSDGSRGESSHSIRMYTPVELVALLEHGGFRVDDMWGGYEGSALELDSRRLIVAATRE